MNQKQKGVNTLMAQLPMSNNRELRIELSRFKGKQFVAARVWEPTEAGMRPKLNQGINFQVELIGQFTNSLQKVAQLAMAEKSQGTLDFTKAANDD